MTIRYVKNRIYRLLECDVCGVNSVGDTHDNGSRVEEEIIDAHKKLGWAEQRLTKVCGTELSNGSAYIGHVCPLCKNRGD